MSDEAFVEMATAVQALEIELALRRRRFFLCSDGRRLPQKAGEILPIAWQDPAQSVFAVPVVSVNVPPPAADPGAALVNPNAGVLQSFPRGRWV